MNGLQGLGAAIVKFLWKIAVAIILVVFVAALVSWARGNPRQAQATTNKVMTAGASVIGWAADGVTGMTGGSAAHEGPAGPETIWVESKVGAPWSQPLASAIILWNRGLTTTQLRLGKCQSGDQCIKVSEADIITPDGESLLLGKTSTFWGSVKFNRNAVGRSVHDYAFTACHELGHALGLNGDELGGRDGHSTSKRSCMYPSAKGAATHPDRADYAAVNAEYGH